MGTRRTYGSYNDGCATAHALDLIGERWTMIVVRELLLGPKRFAHLQQDVQGIGPSVLAQRLQHLESEGIAERRHLPAPADVDVYALTERGLRLEAVNTALAAWAADSPGLPWDADMSPDTLVLAMRAHARPLADRADATVVALHLVDSRRAGAAPVTYTATMTDERTTVVRDAAGPAVPHAVLRATTRALKRVVIGEQRSSRRPTCRSRGSAGRSMRW
ncbi:helix-turn-helix domain-containing protein [Cellulomonas sp.]|uniref:winged helix-turn-helix transcriptional regulator n=1 Tax=Cellulomonas sp. TaxID=40001 RepID=UPI0025900579|nr:helix-turn-helix domain-containing protein [Cellulomonas sp.]MCR6690005.1 helix-turn-helix transcriptional regulator [Cellulomonas sp.]